MLGCSTASTWPLCLVFLSQKHCDALPGTSSCSEIKRRGEKKTGEEWKEEERSGEKWRGVERSTFQVPGSLLRSTTQKKLYKQTNVEGSFSHPGTPMLPHKALLMTQHGPNMAPTWPQHGRNIGPTWPQHGPNLNPKWIQMAAPGPNLGPMFLLAGLPGRETKPEITLNKKKKC